MVCRSSDANRGSLLGATDDLHVSANPARSLLHAHEPKTSTSTAHRIDVESSPVVGHRQLDVRARSLERNRKPLGVAMEDPITQRLLGDPEQTHHDIGPDVSEVAVGPEPYLNAMPLLDFGAVRLQRRSEADQL